MSKSVSEIFSKYRVGIGPMPSVENLAAILLELNDSLQVTQEEVTYVREVALSLGACEESASISDMRRAIAAWYLHIRRGETTKTELIQKMFEDTKGRLANMQEYAKQIYRGDLDYTS